MQTRIVGHVIVHLQPFRSKAVRAKIILLQKALEFEIFLSILLELGVNAAAIAALIKHVQQFLQLVVSACLAQTVKKYVVVSWVNSPQLSSDAELFWILLVRLRSEGTHEVDAEMDGDGEDGDGHMEEKTAAPEI